MSNEKSGNDVTRSADYGALAAKCVAEYDGCSIENAYEDRPRLIAAIVRLLNSQAQPDSQQTQLKRELEDQELSRERIARVAWQAQLRLQRLDAEIHDYWRWLETEMPGWRRLPTIFGGPVSRQGEKA